MKRLIKARIEALDCQTPYGNPLVTSADRRYISGGFQVWGIGIPPILSMAGKGCVW